MFRALVLFATVATLALGLGASTEALPSSNSSAAGGSGPEEPVTPLATEKQQLEKKICDTSNKAQNATELDADKGPKKVVVTEKKVEEFPDNVTKEVTVTKKAEKGPSNQTQENTVVERKTVQDIDSDSGSPKKNVTIEIESENKVCDNATEQDTEPAAQPAAQTNQSKEEPKTRKLAVPLNETQEVEEEIKQHEHESCDQLRKELVMSKAESKELLGALKKVIVKMTPAKKLETAKMIMGKDFKPKMATEVENATHVAAETPAAAKPKQETKTIIVKEATEA